MLKPEEIKNRVVLLRHFLRKYARHTYDCAVMVAVRHPERVLPHVPVCTCGFDEDYAALGGKPTEAYQTRG